MRSLVAGLGLVMAVVATGCESEESAPGVQGWEGPHPHLRMLGDFDGEALDIDLRDPTNGPDAHVVCVREYADDDAEHGGKKLDKSLFLWEIRLRGQLTVRGQRRAFEVEFKRQHFSELTSGSKLTVIPRNDQALPPSGQMWLEWEWHDAETDSTIVERAAREGEFTLGQLTGSPEDGVIPSSTGKVGGTFFAKWSESEWMSMSFTVPCGDNEVDDG